MTIGEVHSAGYSRLPAHPGLLRRPPAPPEAGQSGTLSQPRHHGPAPEAAQDARRGKAANTVKRELRRIFYCISEHVVVSNSKYFVP